MEKTRGLILIAQAESALMPPLLTQAGYHVEQTTDASSIFSDYDRLTPDLIILDSVLSGDAFALCAQLRDHAPTPILMLTPNDEQAIERAYQAGANDMLLTPVQPVLLLHRVQALLEARAPENGERDQRRLGEALRNTAAALSSTLDQSELLDRILEQINIVVPSESANVMLIEDDFAYVARARGYEDRPDRTPVDDMRLNIRTTASLRWMIENSSALLIPNTDTYAGWEKLNETDPWLKSYVAAPIRIGKTVIGFLNIDSSKPYYFNEADADHLQIFADQAAIAIRNARLFDSVLREASALEKLVSERTAELDYERQQMRAIIDAMTEGVAYTEYQDKRYVTRYVNQALTQMTGYTDEEWGVHSLQLFRFKGMTDAEFEQLERQVSEALRESGIWRQEIRMLRKDGSEFDAVTTTTRVDNADREIVGLVTVIRDVSREKALEMQKERFVAYASHELRTPITNLKTRLYLMQRQPQRLDEHMQVLEYVTDRMKRLVEDLLDISRFERGVIKLNYEDVALQKLIRTIVAVQLPEAERKLISLTCELSENTMRVRADGERLAQVITNLLSNAINYTPSGGRIVARLTQADGQAVVEVEDSGIGISEEHLPHIFQPFYRVVSQVEGSGLGLSITQEIIELHGGKIEVTSQLGVGSVFRFWLPILNTANA
jgi:PAS domain S-box-containing protein